MIDIIEDHICHQMHEALLYIKTKCRFSERKSFFT